MRARLTTVVGALAAITLASNAGDKTLLTEIHSHLDQARKSAAAGNIDTALAHANVVLPDRILKIKINCSSVASSRQGPYRNALSAAVRMWDDVLGEKQFEFVETGGADVVVHFQPSVIDRGQHICGKTHWVRGLGGTPGNPVAILSADVHVRMSKPNSDPMTFEQMRACVAHELGHVLGLSESPSRRGIMGPMNLARPAMFIDREDIGELLRARSEARQIKREQIAQK